MAQARESVVAAQLLWSEWPIRRSLELQTVTARFSAPLYRVAGKSLDYVSASGLRPLDTRAWNDAYRPACQGADRCSCAGLGWTQPPVRPSCPERACQVAAAEDCLARGPHTHGRSLRLSHSGAQHSGPVGNAVVAPAPRDSRGSFMPADPIVAPSNSIPSTSNGRAVALHAGGRSRQWR